MGRRINERALSFFTLYTSVLFESVQQAHTGISCVATFYHAKFHLCTRQLIVCDCLLETEH